MANARKVAKADMTASILAGSPALKKLNGCWLKGRTPKGRPPHLVIYSPCEAAERLKMSERTMSKLISCGEMKSFKMKHRRKVRLSEMRRWLGRLRAARLIC